MAIHELSAECDYQGVNYCIDESDGHPQFFIDGKRTETDWSDSFWRTWYGDPGCKYDSEFIIAELEVQAKWHAQFEKTSA